MPTPLLRTIAAAILFSLTPYRISMAVETARIDATDGAPRLMIDGKPQRMRVFWGAPGARVVRLGSEGKAISYEFVASDDAPAAATLHFRFGQTPGDIWIDDLSVVEVGSGTQTLPTCDFETRAAFDRDWHIWPPKPANTVGDVEIAPAQGDAGSAALHVALHAPPGEWPDFHIYHEPKLTLRKGQHYRVSFWARAVPERSITMAFYRPDRGFQMLGGAPDTFDKQIRLAAAAGVNLVSFPCDLPWAEKGEPDFGAADGACRQVLGANPNALLIPRIGVDAPPWWLARHADDAMAWDDAAANHQPHASPASAAYRHDASQRLAALIEHLEATFGPHIAGYHPCGQNTGEFFYQDTWLPGLSGYGKVETEVWRKWLSRRYSDAVALRAAWHDARADFASAVVPTAAARRASPAGSFRDPATEQPLIDFAEFQQQMMADCVCDLAHVVRQATHGRKLVLFFYGYSFEFGIVPNAPAVSGHYALRRVLNSADIDVLCSPISYFDRGPGGSAPAMTAAESVALAGKMYLMEDDTYTYLASGSPPGSADRVNTAEATRAELLRNTGQCALRNFGTWWMDLTASGWFNDPTLWTVMEQVRPLDEAMLAKPTPFHPDIAVIVAEAAMLRITPAGQPVTGRGVYEARHGLGRSGAPYGQYLLDDVLAGKVHAKLYVILTPWSLSPAQQEQLLKQTHGAARLWMYTGGASPDPKTRTAVSFPLRIAANVNAVATPTQLGHKEGLSEAFGIQQPLYPQFSPDAHADEVLATYSDGSPAVAIRRTADGIDLFNGVPVLPSELVRLAARRAGVHLLTDTDCDVYANGGVILLHGTASSTLKLNTAPPAEVHLEKGETRIFPGTASQ